MNYFTKLGIYEAAVAHGLDPLKTEAAIKAADFDPDQIGRTAATISKVVMPLLDDASVAAFRRSRVRGAQRTERKQYSEDVDAGRHLDKVAKENAYPYDLVKAIALSSILAGNLGGGLYFFLSQHAKKENAINEALKRRLDLYRHVNQSLKRELEPSEQPTAVAATNTDAGSAPSDNPAGSSGPAGSGHQPGPS